MKSLIAALFVSTLSIGIVSAETTLEQKAMDLFLKLYTIPDQVKATSPAQNELLKGHVARDYIKVYAQERKVSVRSALEELNRFSNLFADQRFGNKDGKGDADEFQKFQDATRNNVGFRTLRLMIYQYQR